MGIDRLPILWYNWLMIKYIVEHKYRDCTIKIVPVEEFVKATIHDNLSCELIRSDAFLNDETFKVRQVITECELFVDDYIDAIESIGNVK